MSEDFNKFIDEIKDTISKSESKLVSSKNENIYIRAYYYNNKWVDLKKREFKENKSGIIEYHSLYNIKHKDIPFEALILTMEDIDLRNDIYKDIFINDNINEDSLTRFIDNIFLFYDMTDKADIIKTIDDILSLKHLDDNSKEVLNNLKEKMMSFNDIRKKFDHTKFVREYVQKIPVMGMAIREHGQPYKRFK